MASASNKIFDASETLLNIAEKIASSVLKESGKMNPKTVSLVSRVKEDVERLGKLVKALGERAQSMQEGGGVRLAPYFYAYALKNQVVIAKASPRRFMISFNTEAGEVSVSTNRFKASISPGRIKIVSRGFSVEFNPYSRDDYVEKYNEIKYLVNELESVFNQKLIQSLNVKLGKISVQGF
ncbi:MAG: hypothetical protein ACO2OS_05745 [Thermosphaera aggregans]|uniref:hypothetical protein n=1 Tax=Thermosphaera aggregans TaxID=54254 RepID=UPI003C0B0CF1